MISKSKSRSNKSFYQLYEYMTNEQESIINTHNLYSNPYNQEAIIQEFLENATYIDKAIGKNYLYHEVISLPKNKLSPEQQTQILTDLAQQYINLRAKNHLAFTAIHKQTDHTHIHLMISANEIMGNKRIRLSQKQMRNIQESIENYKNTHYPQLGKTQHYQYTQKQTQQQTQQQELLQKLEKVFTAKNKMEFKKLQKQYDLAFEPRGKTIRVIYEQKPHRLKTLGVLEQYENCIVNFKQTQKQTQQQEQQR